MTTPRDFERLSDYIDNQLSPNEKARLESRLAAEAELRAALDDLRAVKRALRLLPILKVPRNFTLTPAQARQRTPARYPALQLAAALASLAFIVVFGGDLALGLSAGSGAAAPAPEAALAQRNADATESPAADESAAGSTGTTGSTPTAAGPTTLMAIAPTETPTPEASFKSATPAAASTGNGGGAADGTSGVPVAPGPTITPAFPEITLTPTQTPSTEQYAAPAETPALGLGPLRYIEITLGVLAVLLIAAAFFLRR